MHFYRPKSFRKLVLIGFTLVMLPLVIAVLVATVYIDRLAAQSQSAISRAVQVLQGGRTLGEQITAMERHVRQFQVLGDETLFQAYADTHEQLQQVTHNLAAIIRNPAQEQQFETLATTEQALFDTVMQSLRVPEKLSEVTPDFLKLTKLAQAILAANDVITAQDMEAMQETATKVHRILVWQTVALILGAIVFSAIFIPLISRPIRQIDQAIQRLGLGELETAIRITGPYDLQYLGERLNWLRRRLGELEEEKRKFLRHVSHELKTPLTALREGTSLLAEGVVGTPTDAQREVLDILQHNGIQLQKLIEDLLNFHQAQARTTAFDLKPVQLDRLLEQVLTEHKLAMMAKTIHLVLSVTRVLVLGDEDKLRTVVDNLLSNAVKYAPPHSALRVTLTQHQTRAVLDVIDQGPGIAPQEQHLIFEAFYQGSAPYEGHVKGSGLGLAIAREYVLAHHGTLEVTDDGAPGAHFRVTLPVEIC